MTARLSSSVRPDRCRAPGSTARFRRCSGVFLTLFRRRAVPCRAVPALPSVLRAAACRSALPAEGRHGGRHAPPLSPSLPASVPDPPRLACTAQKGRQKKSRPLRTASGAGTDESFPRRCLFVPRSPRHAFPFRQPQALPLASWGSIRAAPEENGPGAAFAGRGALPRAADAFFFHKKRRPLQKGPPFS